MAHFPSPDDASADLFVIQVANTKHPGGIETSVQHYHRMLDAIGVPSICIYGGPARDALEGEGMDVWSLPRGFASPLHRLVRSGGEIRDAVMARVHPETTLVTVVHSDRCLPAIRRLFPQAVTITPCHSDKSNHKGDADIVVTLNERQRDLVLENLGAEKNVVCIGNPYVPREEQERWRPRDEDDVFRILFASRFTLVKDPLVLIRAAAELSDELTCEICFVGSGVLEGEAKALVSSLGVEATFHGWQTNPWAFAAQADCFVLPSHWEGLPFVLLEALARGIPIIASDIAGNRAALGDGKYGLLFEMENVRHLADCILQTATDKAQHRAMAEAGIDSVVDRFGAHAFGAKLIDAVRSVERKS